EATGTTFQVLRGVKMTRISVRVKVGALIRTTMALFASSTCLLPLAGLQNQ
ncbi:5434_t:CDS:2, partial [Cetraspora pellucida]